MALADAVKGSDKIGQLITWSPVFDLTGATLSGVIRESPKDSNSERAITGALALSDAENGVFSWAYSDADVAESGTFWVKFTAAFSGSLDAVSRWERWKVHS